MYLGLITSAFDDGEKVRAAPQFNPLDAVSAREHFSSLLVAPRFDTIEARCTL